jgi:hypothetical protein
MLKKITRALSNGNEFVPYVDAIGQLNGTQRLLEWKTTSARYPDQPEGLTSLDLQPPVFLSPRNSLPAARGRQLCASRPICLGNESLIETKLIRQPGSDLNWLDVLRDERKASRGSKAQSPACRVRALRRKMTD